MDRFETKVLLIRRSHIARCSSVNFILNSHQRKFPFLFCSSKKSIDFNEDSESGWSVVSGTLIFNKNLDARNVESECTWPYSNRLTKNI